MWWSGAERKEAIDQCSDWSDVNISDSLVFGTGALVLHWSTPLRPRQLAQLRYLYYG